MTEQLGWIGVDLDGTLAHYEGWTENPYSIGQPIPEMASRVKTWLSQGKQVKIFTARIHPDPWRHNSPEEMEKYLAQVKAVIENWSLLYLGKILPITYSKDSAMIELWDDRAVQVIPNTGRRADGLA